MLVLPNRFLTLLCYERLIRDTKAAESLVDIDFVFLHELIFVPSSLALSINKVNSGMTQISSLIANSLSIQEQPPLKLLPRFRSIGDG